MRHILGLAIVLVLVSVQARAEDKSDGCGLGWQITKKSSFSATTTRGTTNAFVPPTFGMTSGTIGCDRHSLVKNDQEGVTYAVNNYEPLTIEMAQGQGEFLQSFARTMGCSDAATASFGHMTQSHYQTITDDQGSAIQLYKNVKRQIQEDPALASLCGAV